jgi:DNA repair protein RecO
MPRETKYHAIILKKQPLGEADELITAFSKEAGKLRFLAKSVKLAKSKLQYALQNLFLINLRLAGAKLPIVTGAEIVETFFRIRTHLPAAKLALYATELMVRFTADEHKNAKLFQILLNFLRFLNAQKQQRFFSLGLAKFKIAFLEAVGLKIHFGPYLWLKENLVFSNKKGGFTAGRAADGIRVSSGILEAFSAINAATFNDLSALAHLKNLRELQGLLSGFIEYQLEREVKSEKFLDLWDVV